MKQQNNAARGPARDKELWQRLVNEKFGGEQPILSDQESISAAKRLYRMAMGKPFSGKVEITSGRRYSWVRRGVLYVNPDHREGVCRGLRALIHDLSHYCHARLHPKDAPHSARQAYVERDMVDYALKHGFLEGSLKSKAKAPEPKPDIVQRRYAIIVRREKKWAEALAQAKRLHAKAAREAREYERRHGDRLKAA